MFEPRYKQYEYFESHVTLDEMLVFDPQTEIQVSKIKGFVYGGIIGGVVSAGLVHYGLAHYGGEIPIFDVFAGLFGGVNGALHGMNLFQIYSSKKMKRWFLEYASNLRHY